MTNQPLTELEIIEHFGYSLPSEDIDRDYLAETYRVLRRYKRAYATQKNTELVADNKRLRHSLEDLTQELHILNDIETMDVLRAENERLKQQIAWQPISELPEEFKEKQSPVTLLWFACEDTMRVVAWLEDDWIDVETGIPIRHYFTATHWKLVGELPQPPKEAIL